MNKKPRISMILIATVLVALVFGCTTTPVRSDRAQTLTPEEQKILVQWALKELNRAGQPYCLRHSYGRGVGVPVSACPKEQEKDAWLCYRNLRRYRERRLEGRWPGVLAEMPGGFP